MQSKKAFGRGNREMGLILRIGESAERMGRKRKRGIDRR